MRLFRLFALGIALTSNASASSTFPGVVASELHLGAPPRCTLCHQTESGGANTVDKPFGLTMIEFGVTKGDVGALRGALQRDEAEGTDSDGDGISDYDELRAGKDPNVPQAADGGRLALRGSVPPLQTGCSMRGRGKPLPWPTIPAVASALWILMRRPRRMERELPR